MVEADRVARGRIPVLDGEGRAFGSLDFETPDHVEVLLEGAGSVRIARSHFAGAGGLGRVRLKVKGDHVFLGKGVTTIDGIDLGTVAEVVHAKDGGFEALIAVRGAEGGALAVPLAAVREVSAHIILEPSAEEVRALQEGASRSPAVAAALARARP